MRKILMNRKPINGPWGGGNLFVRAISENAKQYGCEIVYRIEKDIDAILMIDPRYDDLGISANEIKSYKIENPKVKVVHRVNECDARKATSDMDAMLSSCSYFTDATVFVSRWIKDYFTSKNSNIRSKNSIPWACSKQHVVYNGVNHQHFRLAYNKINTKTKIIAHHWSNNQLKGFDIYDKIDKWIKNNNEYEFVYIGRSQGRFKNAQIINPIFGKKLGDELQNGDIYVSASRWDPGPNHIIESLSCEIPTFVHEDGGGAVEFAGQDATYSSFEDLIEKFKRKEFPTKRGWEFSWNDCAQKYFKIIEDIC